MDDFINFLAAAINNMSVVLGNWTFLHNIADDINTIKPYIAKANILMPLDVVFTVLSLYLGLQIILSTYYWINRAINLIRGAG